MPSGVKEKTPLKPSSTSRLAQRGHQPAAVVPARRPVLLGEGERGRHLHVVRARLVVGEDGERVDGQRLVRRSSRCRCGRCARGSRGRGPGSGGSASMPRRWLRPVRAAASSSRTGGRAAAGVRRRRPCGRSTGPQKPAAETTWSAGKVPRSVTTAVTLPPSCSIPVTVCRSRKRAPRPSARSIWARAREQGAGQAVVGGVEAAEDDRLVDAAATVPCTGPRSRSRRGCPRRRRSRPCGAARPAARESSRAPGRRPG